MIGQSSEGRGILLKPLDLALPDILIVKCATYNYSNRLKRCPELEDGQVSYKCCKSSKAHSLAKTVVNSHVSSLAKRS